MPSQEEYQKIREAEIEYCRSDCEYFIDTYGHIEDKDASELIQPFQMWKEQREALQSILSHKWNVILKARQLGFSWLVLHVAAWLMLCQSGRTVIGLSKTEEEAKELVRRLAVIFRYMPTLIAEKGYEPNGWKGAVFNATALTLTISFPNKEVSVFKGLASAPGAGRSFTADLIIFDEWAFQQFAREIWQGGFPTINRPNGGKVIGLSTIERGSLFEELFTDPDNGFNKIFIPWYADPRRDAEWYEKTKRALGDLITEEYPATIEEALMVPGGAMFPEIKKDTHETDEILNGPLKRYVAIDYGLDMLSAHWIVIDVNGNAQCYREYNCPDLTVSKAANTLLAISSDEIIDMWLAPPDLWNRRQETGKSVATIFSECGINLVKVSNDIEDGVAAMKEWFMVRENTGKPKFTFLKDTCKDTIRCLQKIQKDKLKPNRYAKTPHDLTHNCLVGDTLVATPKGYKRLDSLIRKRGKILCVDEFGEVKISKFKNACMTNPDAEIYEIELEDGTKIKSTFDHRFLTEDGFKEVSQLSVGMELTQVSVEKFVSPDIQDYNKEFCNTLLQKKFFRKLGKFFLQFLK